MERSEFQNLDFASEILQAAITHELNRDLNHEELCIGFRNNEKLEQQY